MSVMSYSYRSVQFEKFTRLPSFRFMPCPSIGRPHLAIGHHLYIVKGESRLNSVNFRYYLPRSRFEIDWISPIKVDPITIPPDHPDRFDSPAHSRQFILRITLPFIPKKFLNVYSACIIAQEWNRIGNHER